MAQQGIQLHQGRICCSICLDLLKDPVTIPCGHSYCMRCITRFWDEEDKRKISCPQCRQTFTSRPVLVKSTMLADLVEVLKKTKLRAAPADHCYAGPADVSCDFCTGRKLRAVKSCLQCVFSYCEKHLQPHFDVAPLKKHKLVDPIAKLQENMCCRHDEVMKMFCRTDQQCICYLCSVEEHKGHDTVSAATERAERQSELSLNQQEVRKLVNDKERDVKTLQEEVETINRSAEKAVRDSMEIFVQLIRLLEKKSSEVRQHIRAQQKIEVCRVKLLVEKLAQEIAELRKKDEELLQLSHTEDHIQFLHNCSSLPCFSDSTKPTNINIRPLRNFEEVTTAVSKIKDNIEDTLVEGWTKISLTPTDVDVFPPPAGPKTRAEFMRYSQPLTIDPNTVYTWLSLSEGNRKATFMSLNQSYCAHPDRFTDWFQVLSTENMTGRCYWEVEWSGGEVEIAVAYKDIKRRGNESRFGYNEKSWSLYHYDNGFTFKHNSIATPLVTLCSSRVGVYLDHSAGLLCFYSVSENMILLHRVQTTFSHPLCAGLRVYYPGDTAELCLLT